ncbi:hypothetical protein KDA_53930 [Dictyobacter alpinus]|uniref:NnrS family protein n=1 Tax=Dictyobacter alpinus TaxID=2014873 RepID=A0A402BF02_9CHLR|nr:hypothetical protein [Dictyobacter alpinus]GCE29909.1 hypothetical protein KDA_53930 [Dictyobacter alpinus]
MKAAIHSHDQPGKARLRPQEPFARIAPLLKAALLLGVCGGFALATVLTITQSLPTMLGSWWVALVQAHGHLQLYGWSGLFVVGVSFHFLPRLRGTPIALPHLLPWFLGFLMSGLVLRALSQPLIALIDHPLWRVLLVVTGILEAGALLGFMAIFFRMSRNGPPFASRPAFVSIFPLLVLAFSALGLAGVSNLYNVIQASMGAGIVPTGGDELNITLGLLGFLLPVAFAMSARALPMYAGLSGFPPRTLRLLTVSYALGLFLLCLSFFQIPWQPALNALGMCCIGGTILMFIGVFLRLMLTRGQLPQHIKKLATEPTTVAQSYKTRVSDEGKAYGPFVALVASSYLWAMLGGILLLADGLSVLISGSVLVDIDIIRHSLTIGFISLLISGIAPRMLPGFSGKHIASASLVRATLWLGNIAALLRVGVLLLSPLASMVYPPTRTISELLFALSGPIGLIFATCLLINIWPTLR